MSLDPADYDRALRYSAGASHGDVDAMLNQFGADEVAGHGGHNNLREITADALSDTGRESEAALLRDLHQPVLIRHQIIDPHPAAPPRPVVKSFSMEHIPEPVQTYAESAMWVGTGDDDQPLDQTHSLGDIHPSTWAKMDRDWHQFHEANFHDIGDDPRSYAPHHFNLTRNGHGTGFWDHEDYYDDEDNGGVEGAAQRLTDAAHKFGEFNLYVGDEGMIHGHPG